MELAIPDPLCSSLPLSSICVHNGGDSEEEPAVNTESSHCDRDRDRGKDGYVSVLIEMECYSGQESVFSERTLNSSSHTDLADVTTSADDTDRRQQRQEQGQGQDQSPGAAQMASCDSDTRGRSEKNPHQPFGDQDAMRRLGDWLREQEASEDALSLLQQDGWMR